MNKNSKFSIFRVTDYKGGDLCPSINLSYSDLITELSYMFEDALDVDVDIASLDKCFELVKEYYNDDFYTTYAGGDGFCGEIYEHVNGELSTLQITNEILFDIAKILFEERNIN